MISTHEAPSDRAETNRSASTTLPVDLPSTHPTHPSNKNRIHIHPVAIAAILSTAFAYGCIMTTLFLLILPLECKRMEAQLSLSAWSSSITNENDKDTTTHLTATTFPTVPMSKSVALGIFAAIAGLTQLISPLIGMLSDHYRPPLHEYPNFASLGKRLPYLFFGTLLALIGILVQYLSSLQASSFPWEQQNQPQPQPQLQPQLQLQLQLQPSSQDYSSIVWTWLHYLFGFTIHNIGLNITYTVMIAFLPDLIPECQIGRANGTLALMLVLGSLFGFYFFHLILLSFTAIPNTPYSNDYQDFNPTSTDSSSYSTFLTLHRTNSTTSSVFSMYKVYFAVVLATAVLTFHFVLQRQEQMQQVHVQQNTPLEPCEDNDDPTHSKIMIHTTLSSSVPYNNNSHMEECAPFPNLHLSHNHSSPSQKTHSHDDETSTTRKEIAAWPPIHLLVYFLLYEPIASKSMAEIRSAFWIESTGKYHDFFIVTMSRFFYYMGISSQTFFLYFVHDAILMSRKDSPIDMSLSTMISSTSQQEQEQTFHPEAAVSLLAILGQVSGAFTCYPVGILSDKYFGGRRKIFVYVSCLLLSMGYLALLQCTSLRHIMYVCMLLGAANGVYLTMDTSLAVDTLPQSSSSLSSPLSSPLSSSSSTTTTRGTAPSNETQVTLLQETTNPPSNETQALLQTSTVPRIRNENSSPKDGHGAAQLLGVWGIFGFLGSALGPLIGGMALLMVGREPYEQEDFTLNEEWTDNTPFEGSNPSIDSFRVPIDHNTYKNYYTMKGYTLLFSLSAFYFFCSAITLTFIKKKGV